MIEEFDDLDLPKKAPKDISEKEYYELIESKIKEKLGISFSEINSQIVNYIKENSSTIVKTLDNIAPYGDYSKLMHSYPEMEKFILSECIKLENWKLQSVSSDSFDLLRFNFFCEAVKDLSELEASVFINKSGKIKHIFIQGI